MSSVISGRLTSSAPLMTVKSEECSGLIVEKANSENGRTLANSSKDNGEAKQVVERKRNSLKRRDARSYKFALLSRSKGDEGSGKTGQPSHEGKSSTSAKVSRDEDKDAGKSSLSWSKRRRLDFNSSCDSPSKGVCIEASAVRSPQDKDSASNVTKDKKLVGKDDGKDPVSQQTLSFTKEHVVKNEELHLLAKVDDEYNAGFSFQCNRFVEYWIPAKLSNLQLEQYCSTLLLNSAWLCSRLKSGNDSACLHEVITSTRKCCDHPYLLDQSLRSIITKDLTPEDKLKVEIQASGKLQLLDEILLEAKKQGLRVVILFKLIRSNGLVTNGDFLDDLICQRFGEESYVRIEGDFPRANQQASVDMFNDKKSGRFVILIEDRACKRFIKLSAVDIVILFDSSWNPQNELKAIQRITICSRSEQLKVFRLYSSCTVEEKALILAKEGMAVDNNTFSLNRKTCHTLLTWGSLYLFSKLDEFHGCCGSASFPKISSEQSFLSDVLSEFLTILNCSSESGHSRKNTIITKVTEDGSCLTAKFLAGEKETELISSECPTLFWTNLLRGRCPMWKFLPESSSRIRRKVIRIENPARESEFECDFSRKKSINGVNCDDGHERLKRRLKGRRNLNGHCKKRKTDAASENLTGAERTSTSSDERNDGNQITTSVEPGISELCRVLQLPENVRGTATEYLDFMINCFHVSWDEVATSQAFQISLCWIAATLRDHNIDRTESFNLAKLHLNFICNEEEADYIYLKLQSIKEEFACYFMSKYGLEKSKYSSTDRPVSSDPQELEEEEIPIDSRGNNVADQLVPCSNETSSSWGGHNFISAVKETYEVLEGLCGEVVRDEGLEKTICTLQPNEETRDALVLENDQQEFEEGEIPMDSRGDNVAVLLVPGSNDTCSSCDGQNFISAVTEASEVLEGLCGEVVRDEGPEKITCTLQPNEETRDALVLENDQQELEEGEIPMDSHGDNVADLLVPGTNETSSSCDGQNFMSAVKETSEVLEGLCGEVAKDDGPEQISCSLQPTEETAAALVLENAVDFEINLSAGFLTALETGQSEVEVGVGIIEGNSVSSKELPLSPAPSLQDSARIQQHLSDGSHVSCQEAEISKISSLQDPVELPNPAATHQTKNLLVQPFTTLSANEAEMQQLTTSEVSPSTASMEVHHHLSDGSHVSCQQAQISRLPPIEEESAVFSSPSVTQSVTDSPVQPLASVSVGGKETQAPNLRMQQLPCSMVSNLSTIPASMGTYNGRHASCQDDQISRIASLPDRVELANPAAFNLISDSSVQPVASVAVGKVETQIENLRIHELPLHVSMVSSSISPSEEIELNLNDGRHVSCQEAQIPRRTPLDEIFGHCSLQILHPVSNSPVLPSVSIPVRENGTRVEDLWSRDVVLPSLPNHSFQANDMRSSHQYEYPDPLLIEMERMRKFKLEATKSCENLKMQLQSEYAKEMAEKMAEIRNKYESLLRAAEIAFVERKKDLDAQCNKVFLNQLLAETIRFTHTSCDVLFPANTEIPLIIGQPVSVGFGATQFVPVLNHTSTPAMVPCPTPIASLQDSRSMRAPTPQFVQVRNHSSSSPILPFPAPVASFAGPQNSEVRAPASHLQALNHPPMPRPPVPAPNRQTPINPEDFTVNYRRYSVYHNQFGIYWQ